MNANQKKLEIAHLTSIASQHCTSDKHKHSLLDLDFLNAGFVYTDTWGTEHSVHLSIDKKDVLHILYVNNPLAGEYMEDSDHVTSMSFAQHAKSQWENEIVNLIDDYCYRDNPAECGVTPYSLTS